MKTIRLLTTYIILCTGSTLYKGYALSVMWRWFIVSAFGIAPIGIASAIGLTLTIQFITFTFRSEIKDERSTAERLAVAVTWAILNPTLTLTIGAIVKHWL